MRQKKIFINALNCIIQKMGWVENEKRTIHKTAKERRFNLNVSISSVASIICCRSLIFVNLSIFTKFRWQFYDRKYSYVFYLNNLFEHDITILYLCWINYNNNPN